MQEAAAAAGGPFKNPGQDRRVEKWREKKSFFLFRSLSRFFLKGRRRVVRVVSRKKGGGEERKLEAGAIKYRFHTREGGGGGGDRGTACQNERWMH